jgi:phosphoribosylformimino-5-aminoimidazole carboxamide ribotide isomerase
MKFRPCIDLHGGKVKQIVGGSYRDDDAGTLRTNFATDTPAAAFARRYYEDGLTGGHVILIGPGNEQAARDALAAYPGGLQVGGGIRPENARAFLDSGASHVIVTSYVFRDGAVAWNRLEELSAAVGPSRLVIDLSCIRQDARYLVVTDRWQRVSAEQVDGALLERMAPYCDEFLVHAAHVEGKREGVDAEVVRLLASQSPRTVTYAGGVRSLEDLETVYAAGGGRVDVTVGSALDLFGGSLPYADVVAWHRAAQTR